MSNDDFVYDVEKKKYFAKDGTPLKSSFNPSLLSDFAAKYSERRKKNDYE
jgi:hypothetical protein